MKKGIKKSRQEGRQEGEASLLLLMLELRFGTLSESDRVQVWSADSDTLLR